MASEDSAMPLRDDVMSTEEIGMTVGDITMPTENTVVATEEQAKVNMLPSAISLPQKDLQENSLRRSGRVRKPVQHFPGLVSEISQKGTKRDSSPDMGINLKRTKRSHVPTEVEEHIAISSVNKTPSDTRTPYVVTKTVDVSQISALVCVDTGTSALGPDAEKGQTSGNGAEQSVTASESVKLDVPRPEPHGKPQVWAEGRQALCETLPYYRAFQSGAYASDGVVYGFLLNHDSGSRTYVDDEIAIIRAGGHCGRNEEGQMTQISDQHSDEAQIKSFRRNMELKVPVILIIGKQNQDCPSNMQHQYSVMDYFQVTDIWAERNRGKVCFRHRLEKIYRSTKSWWAIKGSPDRPNPPVYPARATRKSCGTCNIQSAQVYQEGWMCFNECCKEFWLIDGEMPEGDLKYNKCFLEERTQWPDNVKPPFDIVPQLPPLAIEDEATYAYSRFGWKGIVCPQCGRCNSRRHWDRWACETESCDFTYRLPQPVISPRAVLDGHSVEFNGHALPMDKHSAPVVARLPQFFRGWRVSTYDLCPGNYITHFHANQAENTARGGAHDLFSLLQKDNCMGLQRFPMKQKTGQGEVLAAHFSLNYGMPYKYVVAVDSTAFCEAPPAILAALHRLDWAANKVITDGTFKKFNELLAVGYFESGKMGFHDDGEKELGPTVATLSLGASATMMLRMKERYYKGHTKSNRYDPEELVLPGAALEQERKNLNAMHDKVSAEHFEARRLALYKGHKQLGKSPIFLKMQLEHGDIVIMHGAEMQKYYEHSVVPSGKLRFALTCRHVKPEQLDPSQLWKGEYPPSPGESYE